MPGARTRIEGLGILGRALSCDCFALKKGRRLESRWRRQNWDQVRINLGLQRAYQPQPAHVDFIPGALLAKGPGTHRLTWQTPERFVHRHGPPPSPPQTFSPRTTHRQTSTRHPGPPPTRKMAAAADLVLWELLPKATADALRAADEVVFCDGACPRNGFGAKAAGVGVYWGSAADPRNVSRPVTGGVVTNNVAELQALTAALQGALAPPAKTTPLVVATDSMYALQCVTQWVTEWQRRGWLTQAGAPVKNRQEVEAGKAALDAAAAVRTVTVVHIEAHRGHPGNEAADALAVAGAGASASASASAGAGASAGAAPRKPPNRRKRQRGVK